MRIKPRKRPARADNAQIDTAAIGRASGSTSTDWAKRSEMFFASAPGLAGRDMPRVWQRLRRALPGSEASACGKALRARGAKANFFLNGLADHRQNLLRDVHHVMRDRNVIGEIPQDFLFGVSVRLELAPGNETIAVKDFCHDGSPQP